MGTACVSDGDLAAFVEGKLGEREHARVLAHVERCDVCRKAVAAAARDGTDAPKRSGDRVGRYVVEGVVGRGAMGVVYAAHDPDLDRRVALKLLTPESSTKARDALRSRLVLEARALARLSHPNVVVVHDVGDAEDEVFIAMELVAGVTLRAFLNGGKRSWREVLRALASAGEGLAAAHDAGILHRDFKPDNVLVGEDGRVRVVDFGLAREGPAEANERVAPGDAHVTRTGALVGTPAYMAPEQLAGGPASKESDQYAFALVVHEALYGARPDGARATAPRPTGRPPAGLKAIVMRGLAADPTKRWPSVRALVHAASSAERRRGRIVAAVASVAAIAVVTLLAVRSPRAAEPCAGWESSFDSAWSAATRDALSAAFQRAGGALPFAAFEREMTGYASTFRAAHRDACVAARVARVESEATLDRRMECLAGRLREAKALTSVLLTVDADHVDRAADAVRSLPDVATCQRVDVLATLEALPADPAARDAVRRLEEDVADANNRHRLDLPDDRARLVGLVDRATTLRWERGRARALYVQALFEHHRNLGDPRRTASAAAAAALSARDDETLADAWILVTVIESWFNRSDDAARAAEQAAAANKRLGSDPLREGRRLWALARAYVRTERDVDVALALFADARKHFLAARGEDHPDVTLVDMGIANVLFGRAEYADALPLYRRHEAALLEEHRPEHHEVDDVRADIAETLAMLGRVDEALAIVRDVSPRRLDAPNSQDSFAVVLERAGRFEDALAARRRVVALCEAMSSDACQKWGRARLGALLVAMRRYADAIDPLERALASRATVSPRDEALTRVSLARALRETKRSDRATTLARDAADLVRPLAERWGGPFRAILADAEALLKDSPRRP